MPDDVYGDAPSPEAVAALVAVLGMAIDRYVKNRARRTIVENAKADPAKPKCRWVVESDACDFCKARGSFWVDPSEVPAESHGGCKCHPAVEYSVLERSRRVMGSVGAKTVSDCTVHIPGFEDSRLINGSEIEAEHVFAGSGSVPYKELRVADRLADAYGGRPEEWSHVAGDGWMFDPVDGRIRKAEIHWMEHPEFGIQEVWWKRWRKT